MNLTVNARDAMNRSGRLTITTGNMTVDDGYAADLRSGDYVVVSVSDTGCGMSDEVLLRAFEPFYTTKDIGKGTGLGLSQVYGFAKQSGGSAQVESEVGRGTTVRIFIPRCNGPVPAEAEIAEDIAPLGYGNATILVVEDDPNVREMVVNMLTTFGYRPLVAGTGPEALAMLQNGGVVDLLLSDVVMPAGMSGTELARAAQRLRPDLKILLTSGYTGVEPEPGAIDEFPFIAKPYRAQVLGRKLKQILGASIAEPIPIDDISGNRLLLIDDEPAVGRLVETVAQSCGFEVVITEDPRSFASTARSWNPTVIMIDLKIPGTDGIELLRALAADQCNADIVVTSGSDQKVLDSALQLGHGRGLRMRGLLPKPMGVEQLRDMLIGFRRLPREPFASDLAEAIASNQLFLEYQPKFDCDLRQFTGVEALVRWRHPDHGIIRPSAFIPIAEESNLIHRLTDWVVRAAAAQAALWQSGGRPFEVAVNISAHDIDDLELPERLAQHCTDAGIAPDCMILELTETGAMRQAVQMMDVLTRLRLKGFKLSIDDFGTGYSSLVQLQQLPFSEAKIDQSFVRRLLENRDCRAIVEITIELARRLGLKVVAEGVEDEPTLDSLIEIGCHVVQGFHLSRPVPADRIDAIIQGRTLLKRNAPT